MADEGGSVDYKREQRLAALEEKRKKLAEAKLKNAQPRSPLVATPPTTPVKQLEGIGSSWNDIVATIEALPPSASSTPVKQVSESVIGSEATAVVPKLAITLTPSIGISQIDIPPKKEVQMYSRGTQTTFTASAVASTDADQQDEPAKPDNQGQKLQARSVSSELIEPVHQAEQVNQDEEEEVEELKKVAVMMNEGEKKATVESTDFLRFMSQTAAIMDRALLLSERYDLLDGKYEEMDVAPRLAIKSDSKDVKRVLTLFDKEYSADQQLNDIDWNPFEQNKVISATYDLNGGSGSAVLEFNLDYDGRLENRLLYAASRITTAKYWTSPDNTYNTAAGGGRLIVGGSYTGQVVIWDVRAAGSRTPVVSVSNSNSSSHSASVGISPHKHPIYALQIIDNRHFASVDSLGTLAIWDIYKMSHPIEELALTWVKTGFASDSLQKDPSKLDGSSLAGSNPVSSATASSSSSPSNEVAVTGISFRDENAFFIASEDGSLFSGQRHGERKGLLQHFRGHQATLSGVRVHPTQTSLPPHFGTSSASTHSSPFKYSLNDLVLTSSVDWSVSLWHPKLTSKPLAVFSDFNDYVMDVAWSNHHPALFAAVDSAGILSIWNLNSPEREIALLTNSEAAPHALHKVLWSPHQADVLIAASHTSHMHVFKVHPDIVTPAGDEWTKLEHTLTDCHEQILQMEREEASLGMETL
jgi:dynein intermediate chain